MHRIGAKRNRRVIWSDRTQQQGVAASMARIDPDNDRNKR